MEKEFVPYELALKLKAIGFNEPCFTKFEDYFNKTRLYPIIATLYLNTPYENEYNGYDQKIINDQSKRWFFTGYKNSVKDHNNDIVSAPTYSQAFRWFREKYNVCGHVRRSSKSMQDHLKANGIELKDFEFAANNLDGSFIKGLHLRSSDTYESATEELLEMLIDFIQQKP